MVLRQLWTDEEADEEVLTTAEYVVELRNRLEETCALAQENLKTSAKRYAAAFNKKTVDRRFTVGDQVLLLLPEKHNKLQLCWQGPYQVLEKVGEADYRIRLKGRDKLFHANLLKRYVTRTPEPEPDQVDSGVAVVVMEDAQEEQVSGERFSSVPVCPLEQKESFKDVTLEPQLSSTENKEMCELIGEFPKILTDLPLRVDLETFEFAIFSTLSHAYAIVTL